MNGVYRYFGYSPRSTLPKAQRLERRAAQMRQENAVNIKRRETMRELWRRRRFEQAAA